MAQSTPNNPQRRLRNKQWFQALAQANHSKQAELSLHWRNALVSENLALVRQVANRLSKQTGQPFDELVSAGSLGLIRAVEAFDLQRDCLLSSFAVPYIRGAILHDQRDNHQPLKTPRRLRELHQRARRLIEQRRRQGAAPLDSAGLAGALNCRIDQLEEAKRVQRALKVLSLDAPFAGGQPTRGRRPMPGGSDCRPRNQRWPRRGAAKLAGAPIEGPPGPGLRPAPGPLDPGAQLERAWFPMAHGPQASPSPR